MPYSTIQCCFIAQNEHQPDCKGVTKARHAVSCRGGQDIKAKCNALHFTIQLCTTVLLHCPFAICRFCNAVMCRQFGGCVVMKPECTAPRCAAPRCDAPCCAVPCCAVPCCAVLCRRLEEAVRWSAAVQKELMEMNWPEILLQWSDCQPQQDPNTGALIWRGLRVRMGISWGRPSYKKPLNTGVHTLPEPHTELSI